MTNAGEPVFDPRDRRRTLPKSVNGSCPVTPLFKGEEDGGMSVSVKLWNMQDRPVLQIYAAHEKFGTGLDDWSEEKEKQGVSWLVAYLMACGAPVGTHAWGEVSATYDPKSASGAARVSYVT